MSARYRSSACSSPPCLGAGPSIGSPRRHVTGTAATRVRTGLAHSLEQNITMLIAAGSCVLRVVFGGLVLARRASWRCHPLKPWMVRRYRCRRSAVRLIEHTTRFLRIYVVYRNTTNNNKSVRKQTFQTIEVCLLGSRHGPISPQDRPTYERLSEQCALVRGQRQKCNSATSANILHLYAKWG